MNAEWLEELKKAVAAAKSVCVETEALVSDYEKCESEISKKYLGAAIKKHASSIAACVPASAFN